MTAIDYFSASPSSYQDPLPLSSSSASSTPYLSPYASRSNRSSSVPSEAGDDQHGIRAHFASSPDGRNDMTDDEGDVTMGDEFGVSSTPAQHLGINAGFGLGLGTTGRGTGEMDPEEEEVNRSFESAMSVFNSPFSMRGSPVGGKNGHVHGNQSLDQNRGQGDTSRLSSARKNGQLAPFDIYHAQAMTGSPMKGMSMQTNGALFGSSTSRLRKEGGAGKAERKMRGQDVENEFASFPVDMETKGQGAGVLFSAKEASSVVGNFTSTMRPVDKENNNIFSGAGPPILSKANSNFPPPKMTSSGHGFGARQRAFGRETSRGNVGTNTAMSMSGNGMAATSILQKPKLGSVTLSRDPSTSSVTSNASASSSSGLMLPPPNPLRRKSQDRMTPENDEDDVSPDMFGQNMLGGITSKPSKKARMGLPTSWNREDTLTGQDQDGGAHADETVPAIPASKGNVNRLFRPSPRRADSMPSPGADMSGSPLRRNNKSYAGDLMDVDSPYRTLPVSLRATSTPKAVPMAEASGSPDLGDFFCDSPSANAGKAGGIGRMKAAMTTASDSSPESGIDSPSSLRPGPVSRLMEKSLSTNAPGLFGSGRPGVNVSSRRTQPYKRPILAPLTAALDNSARPISTASAMPVLQAGPTSSASAHGLFKVPALPRAMPAMMRRAVSVCDKSASGSGGSDPSEEELENQSPSMMAGQRAVSHFEVGPGVSYHQPIQHIGGRITPESVHPLGSQGGTKVSPNSQAGFLGFGENELDGKILPCHKVKEDGLVRISHKTMRNLLDGNYEGQIQRYHIIDCRFDYEYNGGHIDGAMNVNSTTAVEELLLKIGHGVYDRGGELPVPSRSGEELDEKPIVLVFHCEFSNKRAPAFAKHLRSRDRHLNNYVYPKVYYPELYILEGGYCGFFGQFPGKCDPSAYVPMDDPKHFERRDSDLHDFRKFTRTRSFTYGEQQPSGSSRSQPPPAFGVSMAPGGSSNVSRMSAPLGLAAARLAIQEEEDSPAPRIRLGKGRLGQLSRSANESGGDTDDENSGDSSGMTDSPCARPSLNPQHAPGIFGSTKTRVMGRPGLGGNRSAFSKVASYAGSTANGSIGGPSGP